jgi:hypothetical protein
MGRVHPKSRLGENTTKTGHVGNRHPGLGHLRQDRQLLVQRIPPPALNGGKNFDLIDTRHSRMSRLTSSLPAMQLCPLQMGPLHLLHSASRRPSWEDWQPRVPNYHTWREVGRTVRIGFETDLRRGVHVEYGRVLFGAQQRDTIHMNSNDRPLLHCETKFGN